MVLKKLLPHLATWGTYSPGDWRCDEAWANIDVPSSDVSAEVDLLHIRIKRRETTIWIWVWMGDCIENIFTNRDQLSHLWD